MTQLATGLEGVAAPAQSSWAPQDFRMTFQPIGPYHIVRHLDEENDWNSGTVMVRHRVSREIGLLSWKGTADRIYKNWRPAPPTAKRGRRKFPQAS